MYPVSRATRKCDESTSFIDARTESAAHLNLPPPALPVSHASLRSTTLLTRCGRAGRPGIVVNLATPETKFVVGKFAKQLRLPFDDCEIKDGRFWSVTRSDPSMEAASVTPSVTPPVSPSKSASASSVPEEAAADNRGSSSTQEKSPSAAGLDIVSAGGELTEKGTQAEEHLPSTPETRKAPINRAFLGETETSWSRKVADTGLQKDDGISTLNDDEGDDEETLSLGGDGGSIDTEEFFDEDEFSDETEGVSSGGTEMAQSTSPSRKKYDTFEVSGGIAVVYHEPEDGEDGEDSDTFDVNDWGDGDWGDEDDEDGWYVDEGDEGDEGDEEDEGDEGEHPQDREEGRGVPSKRDES